MTSSTLGASPVKSKLLAGLDDVALRHVLSKAQIRRIPPKKDVIIGGERPKHLFLLRTGRAKFYCVTESGAEVVILWNVPGDVMGLVSLLEHPPAYLASAMTVSECEFLLWDRVIIRQLAKAYPRLVENGLRMAVHYLSVYMNRHLNTVSKSAEGRLAESLIHLASAVGDVQPSGVEINITNEQLSSLSDVSRFTTSRVLSKWERDGRLSKQRGRVTLRAPEALMVV
jgi:CRP-like cAMP-binding protein